MAAANGVATDSLQRRSACAETGYSIEADIVNRCLVINLPARWTEPLLAQYLSDLRSQTGMMIRAGQYRGALVDASDFGIQPQAIAAVHAGAMQRARTMYGVKAAMFVTGSRPKLQIKRMAHEAGQRAFDDRGDALDWLLA